MRDGAGRSEVRPQRDIADGARHPRVIWAVGESEGQARNRLTGIRTRGSPGPYEVARPIWPTDVLVSRRSAAANRRKNRLPHRASAGRANCYSDSIRSSRLFLGCRNRRFRACVACQPQRPQSGGLFTRGRTRCLVFGHCLLPLSQLLFLFLESRFGAVTRPFNVGVQSRYSFSSEPVRRTDFPA